MIRLAQSINAFGSPEFKQVLKQEMEQLSIDQLPLQQGLSTSSYALDDARSVMVIDVSDDADFIYAKAGIFYSGVIAGCSCADDPTPVDKNTEYCEVQLVINKKTAETIATLME
ncbi:MAG: hypothetical protein PVF34_11820 [Gammaproteobacteria bacterium]|jgi:hypothetical protein|nr:hypothetical protein [Gammaproteobacteria bacterium]